MIFASPVTDEGRLFLDTVLENLADLRVPVPLNKLEGPGNTVSFLGILFDTALLELLLPLDKLARLRRLVASCLGRKSDRHLDLDSLLGTLSQVAVVVRPGRIFLQQLFFMMVKASRKHYFVHLDSVAWAYLAW